MKKVIRLNENDIENLVKKIIKEEDDVKTMEKKSVELLKTKNGELSSIDNIISVIKHAKDAFEDLVNSKLTGQDGYSKEIDGIVNDFTKLEDKVRKSKETISKFVVQKDKEDHMSYMKQRKMDYMAKQKQAQKDGRYYA